MAGLSTFAVGLPMILYSLSFLSVTDRSAGTGNVDARSTSWPYDNERPLPRWCTRDDAALHSPSGTLHVCAAAAINI